MAYKKLRMIVFSLSLTDEEILGNQGETSMVAQYLYHEMCRQVGLKSYQRMFLWIVLVLSFGVNDWTPHSSMSFSFSFFS